MDESVCFGHSIVYARAPQICTIFVFSMRLQLISLGARKKVKKHSSVIDVLGEINGRRES